MELKLADGNYEAGVRGSLLTVSGTDEVAQRIIMRLTARRGGFAPLPEYGSRLHLLHLAKPSEREAAAKQYVAEALSDERGVKLESLSISGEGAGRIALDLMFSYLGDQQIEVKTVI